MADVGVALSDKKLFGIVAAMAAFVVGVTPVEARSQNIDHSSAIDGPLVLKSVGSFFVGGRTVSRSPAEVGIYGGGNLTIDQMYVQYMIPEHALKPPVVMIHGGTLTGKTYETTPDGRMGWYEYFARRGYPSYVVDQVGRARSGFDHLPYNNVRNGQAAPATQSNWRRVSDESTWVRFRFGPTAGVRFEDSQFPTEATAEFAKQSVPDRSLIPPPRDDANYAALSELSRRLDGAVLIGHSQSGQFPFETALLNSNGIRGLITIEPGGCNAAGWTDEEIGKLAKLPILVVFGDHLGVEQPHGPNWQPYFEDCRAFVSRINAAKGNATLLHTTDLGIRGNSHMMMQDRNNIEIADLIMKWIDQL